MENQNLEIIERRIRELSEFIATDIDQDLRVWAQSKLSFEIIMQQSILMNNQIASVNAGPAQTRPETTQQSALIKMSSSSSLLKQISSSRSFRGYQKVFEHESQKLQCPMKFGIYLPDNSEQQPDKKFPVLFWLSGITCTEENFIIKSGMQRFASAHQIVVVNSDTSPRGKDVPVGYGDDPTFGASAGFYLNATEPKFVQHYQMYSYIVEEFVPFIFAQFPVDQSQCGIFGHSMGGLGALQIGLKNPGLFKSISAFAPISNPINSPLFGHKYFTGFLGPLEENREKWAEYDSTEVTKKYTGPKREILIDQGSADQFLANDLLPDNMLSVSNPNINWKYRLHHGYDHGYYFIQTIIEDHFLFHKKCWTNGGGDN